MQQENTTAHAETRRHFDVTAAETRRHFDVAAERMERRFDLLAESVANVSDDLHRTRITLDEQIEPLRF